MNVRSSLAIVILVALGHLLHGQNQAPVISNVIALADTVFNTLQVTYDLADAEQDSAEVIMVVSIDGGASYCLHSDVATGDIGRGVTPGIGKMFNWDCSHALPISISDFWIKLNANDWQHIDLQQIVDGIDSVTMEGSMNFIEGIRHRTTGSSHLAFVRDTVMKFFASSNLDTASPPVPFGNYIGRNLTGKKEGLFNACKTIIVDGHYDTVNDSPGADDNASSLAGIMELVKIIEPLDLAYTVKFIGFDLEEAGLLGSQHYVTDIPTDEDIAAVINMDMIAYSTNKPNSQTVPTGFNILWPELYQELVDNQFRGNFIMSSANSGSEELMDLFEQTAALYVPDLLVGSIPIPGNGELIPDSRRSDHAAFWDSGYVALHISDGAETRNPNYHDPTDVIDSCNLTFATNVIGAVAATLLRLAIPMHGQVLEVQVQIDPASGIDDQLPDVLIDVSPNPSSGIFVLNGNSARLETNVFNISGQHLATIAGPRIDISEYEPGLYMLRVLDGERVLHLRVLKQ